MYREDNRKLGIRSGLSELELGVRLRYEIRREVAPYVGVSWTRKFGSTADFAKTVGADTRELEVLAGFRFWF